MIAEHGIEIKSVLSINYICGLIEGEGCFTFSKNRTQTIPAFSIALNEENEELLIRIKNTLGLKNKIYKYGPYTKDGFCRKNRVILIIRDSDQLQNIVPLFYKGLKGHKKRQIILWIEKIKSDPMVPQRFKNIINVSRETFEN